MKSGVLQLIGNFYQGGSERQAMQLSRLLHENGHYQVYIACLDPCGELRDEVESLGLGEIPAFPLTSFYDRNALIQVCRFARHLKMLNISIVHTHDFYTNIFGMAGAVLAGVPVRIASRRESIKRPPLQRRVERGAYHLAQAVVANCEEIRQQLIQEGVRASKVVTIYNGLDIARVTPPPNLQRKDACAQLGLPFACDRLFVTIVANMRSPVKDYPLFLRAAQQIQKAVPAAAFLLAGEGELTDSLRTLARQLELHHNTFFLGRCERIAELLAISDVCVLSSWSEGFSNSILEYMAAARPVVATNVGGASEAITEGETGYLVPAGDAEAMAARIISLLQDPERRQRMGAQGRRIVASKFTLDARLENTLSLYKRLLHACGRMDLAVLPSCHDNT